MENRKVTQTFADATARGLAVPDAVGQLATQQDTGIVYIATGVVAGNWAISNITSAAVQIANTLIKDPSLTISSSETTLSQISLINQNNVISLLLPNLTTVSNDIFISSNLILTSIDLSSLTTAAGISIISFIGTTLNLSSLISLSGLLAIQSCPNLTTLTLTNLASAANITIASNNSIVTLSLPALVSSTITTISGNPSLTTISLSALAPTPGSLLSFDFTFNALSVANVNAILVLLDTQGQSNGTIDISGQTPPATPTGAGATAAANLIGKGWTVTTD